jgi:hypothetical protein
MYNQISHKLLGSHGSIEVDWAMTMAERFGLAGIVSLCKPKLAIEIGTLNGGSLAVIAHHSEKVISIDPNKDVKAKLEDKFANVEFISGFSQEVLPQLIADLNSTQTPLDFVLIDGDHTKDGVKTDIEEVLKYKPVGPMWILMHDSFNPDCRNGMKDVDWNSYPHIHWVDYDFVPGFLSSIPGWEDQMWGGFALAYLDANVREGELQYGELLGRQFDKVLPLSVHKI